MNYTKVKSTKHLQELLQAGCTEFVRALGACRSSKYITFSDDESGIEVFNYIDNSTDVYTWDELNNPNNYIKEMIDKEQLFAEHN